MKKTTAKYLVLVIVAMSVVFLFALVATDLPLPEDAFGEDGYYFVDPYSYDEDMTVTAMPTKGELILYGGVFSLIGLLFLRHAARREPKPEDGETRSGGVWFAIETFYQLGFGWYSIADAWIDAIGKCAHYNKYANQICVHADFVPFIERYELLAGWLAHYCYWHDSWRIIVKLVPLAMAAICVLAFVAIDHRYAYLAELED